MSGSARTVQTQVKEPALKDLSNLEVFPMLGKNKIYCNAPSNPHSYLIRIMFQA